jgi:hypothetical protein
MATFYIGNKKVMGGGVGNVAASEMAQDSNKLGGRTVGQFYWTGGNSIEMPSQYHWGEITTAQFIQWLKDIGAFKWPCVVWAGTTRYDWLHTATIPESDCGIAGGIDLCNATIEFMPGYSYRDEYMIRITTTINTTTERNKNPGCVFVYKRDYDKYKWFKL